MSFFEELKQRKVVRVATGYVVAAWIAVQAASIALPAFDAPPWALRAFILLFMLGFPLALVLSWALDVAPDGIQVSKRSGGSGKMLLLAFLLVALALVWYWFSPSGNKARNVALPSPATATQPAAPAPATSTTATAAAPNASPDATVPSAPVAEAVAPTAIPGAQPATPSAPVAAPLPAAEPAVEARPTRDRTEPSSEPEVGQPSRSQGAAAASGAGEASRTSCADLKDRMREAAKERVDAGEILGPRARREALRRLRDAGCLEDTGPALPRRHSRG